MTNYAENTAVMKTYGRTEIAFVRGDGCWLESEDGTRYLDCASGIAVNTLGHAPPKLVAALQAQVLELKEEKLHHEAFAYSRMAHPGL